VRLAVLGFLAVYVPVLLLFGVVLATETDATALVEDGVEIERVTVERSPQVMWAVVALAPAAAGLAWWWSGRAVRPIDRIRALAEEIEETDLSRRIEIGECQCRRGSPGVPLGIAKQQLERVPVARDRMGAGATFCDEMPLEEVLKECRKGDLARHHDAPSGSEVAKRANR
jgi:HAMP domain-containing protein